MIEFPTSMKDDNLLKLENPRKGIPPKTDIKMFFHHNIKVNENKKYILLNDERMYFLFRNSRVKFKLEKQTFSFF